MRKYHRVQIVDSVRLEIDDRLPGARDILKYFHDFRFLPGHDRALGDGGCPKERVVIRVDFAESLDTAGMRALGNDMFVSPACLVDRRYQTRIRSAEPHEIRLESSFGSIEWTIWCLQLGLLRAGYAMIHCLAVERDGRALMLPSWHGVGKTAIAKAFVGQRGWRLLGDDRAILDAGGDLKAFPLPMVLNAAYRALFPELLSGGKRPRVPKQLMSPASRLASQVKKPLRRFPRLLQLARRHNPQTTQINPSEVFGGEALSSSAKLEGVVWLERAHGLRAPQLTSVTDGMVSRVIGSTVREFDIRCVDGLNVAFGLGLMSFDSVYPRWSEIVESGLRDVPCYQLLVPDELPLDDLPEAVLDTLEASGILKAFSPHH